MGLFSVIEDEAKALSATMSRSDARALEVGIPDPNAIVIFIGVEPLRDWRNETHLLYERAVDFVEEASPHHPWAAARRWLGRRK